MVTVRLSALGSVERSGPSIRAGELGISMALPGPNLRLPMPRRLTATVVPGPGWPGLADADYRPGNCGQSSPGGSCQRAQLKPALLLLLRTERRLATA